MLQAAEQPVVVNPLGQQMVELGSQKGLELLYCLDSTSFGDLDDRLLVDSRR